MLGDRYELGERLGSGGMADVYRATDRLLHRDVAVKVLRDVAGNDSDRDRFTAEARTLAGLSHHGLVTVLDAGLAGAAAERPFLVLELVEGSTLADEIRLGPVATDRVAALGRHVAEALAYAHGRDVVHRDVKPGNVLLDRDHRAKLADFGIAKLLGDSAGHTRTGMTIGSAAYLAPEQVRGEPVTPAVDVYSLGLVLLEALTGERAFPGPAMEAAVARLHRDPDIPGHLPGRWAETLRAMTAADPAARPSAREVASMLGRVEAPPADAGAPSAAAGAEATRVMATQQAAPAPAPATPSALDRAGDALAASAAGAWRRTAETTPVLGRRAADGARAGWRRVVAMPAHQKGVAAAVAALLLLIVVVALAAGTSGGDGSGAGETDIPADTPQRFEQPLRDLHDAVNGRS
ncbi:serine/threonine-protein kinase [Nocardioides sp. GCM10027113]|uniref:serine/threonine-protein kinase n=1 Tax=Nocardioides sp. GCM10027113 TaxID=3273405 RepID=UPI003618304D